MYSSSPDSLVSNEDLELGPALPSTEETGPPLLSPEMRKIRHIKGVLLRNLNIKAESQSPSKRPPRFSLNFVPPPPSPHRLSISSIARRGSVDSTISIQSKTSIGDSTPFPIKVPVTSAVISPVTSTVTSTGTNTDANPGANPFFNGHDPLDSPLAPSPTAPSPYFPPNATIGNSTVDSLPSPTRSFPPEDVRRRRRSTREVIGNYSTLLNMQRSFQLTNSERIIDSFFSIHLTPQSPSIYISEISKASMNPEFREFDLSYLPYSNSNTLTIRIWGSIAGCKEWKELGCQTISLDSLEYLGRTLESVRTNLPFNSMIISLIDGFYVVQLPVSRIPTPIPPIYEDEREVNDVSDQSDLVIPSEPQPAPAISTPVPTPASLAEPQSSCSFDMIMKLMNLEECLADSEEVKHMVEADISKLLNPDSSLYLLQRSKDKVLRSLQRTREHIENEKRRTAIAKKRFEEVRLRVSNNRTLMASSSQNTARAVVILQRGVANNDKKLEQAVSFFKEVREEQARIAVSLDKIFPIDPVPSSPFVFTICSLALPDSGFRQMDEDELGAAFGLVAQLISLLSYYLAVPLRYPIQPYGSQSFIVDPISSIQGSRTFPLWIKNALYYRFEYACYLCNKNIEQLMDSQALIATDIRYALANLKNILLVVSSQTFTDTPASLLPVPIETDHSRLLEKAEHTKISVDL